MAEIQIQALVERERDSVVVKSSIDLRARVAECVCKRLVFRWINSVAHGRGQVRTERVLS